MLMLKLAFRNILRNKRRTILTMLSMFGGYFLLVLSLSVQMGSYEQVIDFFTQDNTGHVQLAADGYQDRATLYKTIDASDQFYQQLSSQNNVVSATPRIVSSALAYGETLSFPVLVMGVDAAKEAQISFLPNKVKQGEYFTNTPNPDGFYSALIGAAVARQLRLDVGDELILLSQASDGSLANDLYRVAGIVGSTDGAEARNVYLPLPAAQDFYQLNEQAHYWVVMTDRYQSAEKLAAQLSTEFLGGTEYEAAPWQVVAHEFYQTMQADIEGGYVAYYIIIFLVSIGVLNTVLMSVMERTGEFGVLKAIGTSPKRLFVLIVTETALLAVISCAVGLILALPMNYYLATVGFSLPEPQEVSGIVMEHMRGLWEFGVFAEPALIVLGAALVVSIFPALRAARIVPVEAMRSL